MFALLAVLGAASWGAGDFVGGLTARKAHVLTVLAASQAVGLAGAATWALTSGDGLPGAGDLLPAMGAGAAGAMGLAALYRGLALGAMGIVAPISAASPVVPLAVDLAHGVTPSALQWLGVTVVLAGIVLLSREPRATTETRVAAGVGLALLAALGFGLFVVGLDAASDGGVAWAVTGARSASTMLAVTAAVVVGASIRPSRSLLPAVVAVGFFDTLANVLVALATTRGPAGVVAVLSALYPVVTVALARLVLAERLDGTRRAGGVLALGGAVAVAAG